jgi:hypothetical protein
MPSMQTDDMVGGQHHTSLTLPINVSAEGLLGKATKEIDTVTFSEDTWLLFFFHLFKLHVLSYCLLLCRYYENACILLTQFISDKRTENCS